MIITISEFQRKTKISRHTVYSWIYRDKLPEGIKLAGIGKSKILDVNKKYEHYEKLV